MKVLFQKPAALAITLTIWLLLSACGKDDAPITNDYGVPNVCQDWMNETGFSGWGTPKPKPPRPEGCEKWGNGWD